MCTVILFKITVYTLREICYSENVKNGATDMNAKEVYIAARRRARFARRQRLGAGRIVLFLNGSPALDKAAATAAVRCARASGVRHWRRVVVAVIGSLESCRDPFGPTALQVKLARR